MSFRRCIPVCAMALAACLSSLAQAAPTLSIPTDGSWTEILMDDGLPPYTSDWVVPDDGGASYAPAHYAFTIADGFKGTLTVVDTAHAGDRFVVRDNGVLLGQTGAATVDANFATYVGSADAALADASFSRGVFTLSAGNHVLTGALLDGGVFGSTTGALKLEVSAVPEPATVFSLLAGLGLIGATLRRRAR